SMTRLLYMLVRLSTDHRARVRLAHLAPTSVVEGDEQVLEHLASDLLEVLRFPSNVRVVFEPRARLRRAREGVIGFGDLEVAAELFSDLDRAHEAAGCRAVARVVRRERGGDLAERSQGRSEEHTSELQS